MCSVQSAAPPFGASRLRVLSLWMEAALLTLPLAARADVTVLDSERATVEVGVTAAGPFHVGNANLGTGVFKPDGGINKNRDWSEGFIAQLLASLNGM